MLLTGTLPPSLESSLASAMVLGRAEDGLRVIRASTDRPTISYRVEVCKTKQLREKVAGLVAATRKKLSPAE